MSNRKADWAEDGADSNTGGIGSAPPANTQAAMGSNGNGRQASQKQVDKVVLQYLKSKGYRDAEKALRADAKLLGQESSLGDMAQAFPGSEVGSDASVPNWIMFYNEAEEGNPDAYNQSYGELRRWIDSSLDVYKHELYAASYPVFVHSYLDLLMRGLSGKAVEFMRRYGSDHVVHHGRVIAALKTLTTKAHVEENALSRLYRDNKYGIRMTRVGFELLLSFLQDHHYTLLMRTVNQHLNIRTVDGGAAISSEADADVGITGHTQSQLDHFNSQDIALGPAPLDPFVRDEVERTLQGEAGRFVKDAVAKEASALLDTFAQARQENAASALSADEALPMPSARGMG
ncbi:Transcription initiation factor TFIID subunit 5, partial [Coemansia sp. 'formosensis']